MEDLVWPDMSPNAELHSLIVHTEYRARDVDLPTRQERLETLDDLTLLLDTRIDLPKDFMTFEHFLRIVPTLNMKASPGIPLCYYYTTVGDYLRWDPTECTHDDQRLRELYEDVIDRVTHFSPADPIRVFIKPEFHKQSKAREGRWRLISSVALVDQVIDHMLHDQLNAEIMKKRHFHGVMPGWSFQTGGWREIPPHWAGKDRSAWDWTVPGWLLKDVLSLREGMVLEGPHRERWVKIARYRFSQLYVEPVFQLTNGLRFRQKVPGLQKSGCVNTIMDNSIMQLVLHILVSRRLGRSAGPMFAMGDDTFQPVEDLDDAYVAELAKFSILKETVIGEFCGMHYHYDSVEPAYWAKHLATLRVMDEEVLKQAAASYQCNYFHSRRFNRIREIFASHSTSLLLPLSFIRNIVDGFE